ncbi:MAG: aldehyde ferredoxin oxidoreductase [Clostridiaceae bacterium]
MAKVTGWAGKILRVNLSNGKISTEDTLKYKDFVGGAGIGYKVMFDEVPTGTKPFDEANKVIFAAGPLTGTGIPCTSRTNITSLLPTNPYYAVAEGHMGGNFAAVMKYAGWDAIIIEGKSKSPVYLLIDDDKVSIKDASFIWGQGIFHSNAQLAARVGKEASLALIGQAGENMVPMSVIMNGRSHSAGGQGGIMGSKKLKAIAIKGTGAVHIAGDRKEWLELDKLNMSVIGANNNHVVPSTPQPWAEFNSKGSRWNAHKGLTWGGSESKVDTGECDPKDMNSVGFRSHKGVFDLGPVAEKYTVRMGGCQSCPIRCHSQLKIPQLEKKYGVTSYVANTCMGYFSPGGIMIKGFSEEGEKGEGAMIARSLGSVLADDYGVWCNYGQMGRDFKYVYEKGILKNVLPKEEYDSIPWDKLEAKDPAFLKDFYRRIAYKEGEFSHLGDGSYWIAKRWNLGDEFIHDKEVGLWSPLGFPKHHSNETNAQVGAITSCMFNRDAMVHTLINYTGSGLPLDIQKARAKELFGSEDALDNPAHYTKMNPYKAKFTKWSIVRSILHNCLTVCNYVWPMTFSPLKERGYKGDTSLEAKYYSLATGHKLSEEELDLAGERIFTLFRALTVKNMNTVDMRNKHDLMCNWIFDMDKDKAPFTPGTIKMDRKDMQDALTMFYKEMGWDEKTGAPKKDTLIKLGLADVAAELEKLKLLP